MPNIAGIMCGRVSNFSLTSLEGCFALQHAMLEEQTLFNSTTLHGYYNLTLIFSNHLRKR